MLPLRVDANNVRVGSVVLALIVASVVLGVPANAARSPSQVLPSSAFVDSILWYEQPSGDEALIELANGGMDIYTQFFSAATAPRNDPDLAVVDSYGRVNNLFVNPVPIADPAQFNPFAIREVRNALNYLIDRDVINSQFYGGYGFPHAALWHPASPEVARDPFFYEDVELTNTYAPERARTVISQALVAAGAVYDGTWKWQGNPIVIKVVIRIEDLRLHIGNYVADQLESLGFVVQREYLPASAAFERVYFGDPAGGTWNVYTEGFLIAWTVGWPDDWLSDFHTGASGETIWGFYDPSPELTDVANRLASGNYANLDEREDLVRRGTSLAIDESVRVWLVSGQTHVHSTRVSAVAETNGGLQSPWTGRTARFESPGGTLRIGQVLHLNSAFQPWRGFSWVPDRSIGGTFMDSGLAVHPHTGEHIPMRAAFVVDTAGPTGSLNVPADAQVFNSASNAWEFVAPGTTAMSRVVFDYTFGAWHHGVPMAMNDVLYHVALIARRGSGDIANMDSRALSAEDRLFADRFRGLRVLGPDILEVWTEGWHVDPGVVAAAADVWPETPWEVGELAMATTLHNHTRVDTNSASSSGLVVLDLTRGPPLDLMDEEIADGNVTISGSGVTRPPGFAALIGQGEAEARWAALLAWRTSQGHYFPSNGPFYLDSIGLASRQIVLKAAPSYPLPADRWDALLGPPVPAVAIDPIPPVLQGTAAHVDVATDLEGVPYDDATVRYRIVSLASGTTVLEGQPAFLGGGKWRFDLSPSFTASLPVGLFFVEAAAVSNEATRTSYALQLLFITDDLVAPTSSIAPKPSGWQRESPILLPVSATDDKNPVIAVHLFAAFRRPGGTTWPAPEYVESDFEAPFAFAYAPGHGDGWYRFWTSATDARFNTENISSKPATGDVEIAFDATPPTSRLFLEGVTWSKAEPISIAVIAQDATSGARRVDLYASHSADGVTWTAPAVSATDDAVPFAFRFLPTQGDGRYRLWSVATDLAGNREPTWPPTGDLEVGFDALAPAAALEPLSAFWQPAGPIQLSVAFDDTGSEIVKVRLFESFSLDGTTWSTPMQLTETSTPPFRFSYTPTRGDGRYRLWTLATDAAGNEESMAAQPATGEVSFGRDSVAPRVTSSIPAHGSQGVDTSGVEIRIGFSEAVDRAKAQAAFSINPSVSGTFSWEENTLIFTPTQALTPGTTYTVRIGTDAADAAGNPLEAQFTAIFSTKSASFLPSFLETWVGFGFLIAVIAAAAAAIAVWRSRKKRG